jgi:hypothetical protein
MKNLNLNHYTIPIYPSLNKKKEPSRKGRLLKKDTESAVA